MSCRSPEIVWRRGLDREMANEIFDASERQRGRRCPEPRLRCRARRRGAHADAPRFERSTGEETEREAQKHGIDKTKPIYVIGSTVGGFAEKPIGPAKTHFETQSVHHEIERALRERLGALAGDQIGLAGRHREVALLVE